MGGLEEGRLYGNQRYQQGLELIGLRQDSESLPEERRSARCRKLPNPPSEVLLTIMELLEAAICIGFNVEARSEVDSCCSLFKFSTEDKMNNERINTPKTDLFFINIDCSCGIKILY